jgi:hypothetical protein
MAAAKKSPEVTPPAQESATVFSLLQGVLANPNSTPETIERMIALMERTEKEKARKAFYADFVIMQSKLPIIERKGKFEAQGRKVPKYAAWEDVVEQIQPILTAHNFALSFNPSVKDGMVSVKAKLLHKEGHFEETDAFEMSPDLTGEKNPSQALGSATSYGKRYTGFAVLNIISRDPADGKDDDATAAHVAMETISEAQVAALKVLMKETATEEEVFLKRVAKTDGLGDILVCRYDDLVRQLEVKKTMQGVL